MYKVRHGKKARRICLTRSADFSTSVAAAHGFRSRLDTTLPNYLTQRCSLFPNNKVLSRHKYPAAASGPMLSSITKPARTREHIVVLTMAFFDTTRSLPLTAASRQPCRRLNTYRTSHSQYHISACLIWNYIFPSLTFFPVRTIIEQDDQDSTHRR